jgi:thioredoxin 1
MEEDEELKRIRERKLRLLIKEASGKDAKRTDKKPVEPSFNKPVELTDATFLETIKKYPDLVVDCWAPWCGPCRFVSPIIEELARDYAGKILFGKLNVDQNPIVARQYGIMSIPTLLVFKDGELVDRIVGAMPKRTLEAKIGRHLQRGPDLNRLK